MGTLIDFLKDNFYHVAPILIVGAIGLAIILERTKALLWTYPIQNMPRFFDKLRDLVMADRLSEAITLCEQYRNKPVANVVKEALLRAHQPEALIEDGLEIAVTEATQQVQNRTPYLATIANVSTLLGLLGTILGLIRSFDAIGTASAQQRSALLAAGISTAMNATMMGLAVAIPCMVAFSFLINRTNRLSTAIEQSANRMMDLIKQRYYDAEVARGTSSSPYKKAR